MRKQLALGMALLLGIGSLTACGGSAAPATTAAAPAAAPAPAPQPVQGDLNAAPVNPAQ